MKNLIPSSSPYNTPILPVKKPEGTYHFAQDLRITNEEVIPLHPVVPNPYTLLSLRPPDTQYFTVLHLKDAFLSIPLHLDSQDLSAFTWTDPDTNFSQQLICTALPQGFRESPHLFSQTSARVLTSLFLPGSTILQYVDALLLCSPAPSISTSHTGLLLNYLASLGYHVSHHKAQLSTSSITYLGFCLSPGCQEITTQRKMPIHSIPFPSVK